MATLNIRGVSEDTYRWVKWEALRKGKTLGEWLDWVRGEMEGSGGDEEANEGRDAGVHEGAEGCNTRCNTRGK